MAKNANFFYTRNIGGDPMAVTITPAQDVPWELSSVRLHLGTTGGTSEDFTVTVDSATHTAYDVRLYTKDMEEVQDVLWQPGTPLSLPNTDSIVFAYTNTGARIWGLEVVYRQTV